MHYFVLALILLIFVLLLIYIFLVLYHNWRHRKNIDSAMENVTEYQFPGYEIPIFVDVEGPSDLVAIENLIYEVGNKVLCEKNSSINYKPEVRYRKINESSVEFFVLLKVKTLCNQNSIKKQFKKLLKKRFFENSVKLYDVVS